MKTCPCCGIEYAPTRECQHCDFKRIGYNSAECKVHDKQFEVPVLSDLGLEEK